MLAIYLAMLETEEDQRRFLQLYEACEKRVYAVALKLLGSSARAEDAAQQAWTSLLNRWDRVSALDLLRAERRMAAFPEDWDPPAREEHQENYDYLVSLVRALPESYRRILELKCVEEWTNREIARHLGINESTVASRVLRGKALLRARLEKEGILHG